MINIRNLILLVFMGSLAFVAQSAEPPYSAPVDADYPKNVYWGDTHLHTGLSMDAGLFGARLGLDDAYRFARGDEVTASSGQPAKLGRPLDWLVIADHSDGMGFFPDLLRGDPAILSYPLGKRWYEMIQGGRGGEAALELIDGFSRGDDEVLGMLAALYSPNASGYKNQWDRTIDAAEAYNAPGVFTAFIGYEWTSLSPPGDNLVRLTPKFVRPNWSPSARFSRPDMRLANGSG